MLEGSKVARHILCSDEVCTDCRGIITRVYEDLRRAGDNDRAAFASAVRVLELRHPGQDKEHYVNLVAEWIAAEIDG